MDFVDRAGESAALAALLKPGKPALVRIFGRRRLGKTELLRRVCIKRDGLYLLVDDADTPQVLASLSAQVASQARTLAVPYRDWDSFWNHVATLGKNFIALDEFQRLIDNDPQAITRLQGKWDTELKSTGPSIVLCGSSAGMMQRLTGGRRGPLFGRLTGDLRLRPFDYGAVRLLYPDLDEAERVRRYAVFGATPFYHQFSQGSPLDAAVKRAFLESTAPLRDEPQSLLQLELKSPTRYNSILYEIGNGTHPLRDLESKVGVKRGGLGPYLDVLRNDLDLVRMEDPVCGTRKQARYVFSDPFFAFYYRFIFGNRPRLELGRLDAVWKDIESQLDGYLGHHFEEVVRQALILLNGRKLDGVPIEFDEIGRWWNRAGEELDVVARGPREIIAGEVKWSTGPAGPDVLRDVLRKVPLIERRDGLPVRPLVAVRGGLKPSAVAEAEEARALVLDLTRLTEIFENEFPRDA
ncbi:MAG: ATP-binding protein [Thermoplasmatota archaeon]